MTRIKEWFKPYDVGIFCTVVLVAFFTFMTIVIYLDAKK